MLLRIYAATTDIFLEEHPGTNAGLLIRYLRNRMTDTSPLCARSNGNLNSRSSTYRQ